MTITDLYTAACRDDSDIAAHLPYLHDTVIGLDARVVVELGVRYGNSTTALLAAVERTGGLLWSVDPAPHFTFDSARWVLTVADDLAVADRCPEPIDVLFIDTSHRYAHTVAELDLYAPKVRSGGVILCHDTEFEMDGEEGFPVARALDDWCGARGWSWTNRPGSYGLGVVEVPA